MSHLLNSFPPIAIIGAGAWGTALAIHLAKCGQKVYLWGYEKEQIREMQITQYNATYLPGIRLPSSILCSDNYQEVFSEAQDILIAVPSIAFRKTLIAIKPFLKSSQRVLWATKGLDSERYQLLHEVVEEILENRESAVLSGPSFAKEVAMGLPTAVTLASVQMGFAYDLRNRFQNENFRVDITTDVIGVELGGAIKNVLAMAVGMIEGLGGGANAKAAVMTDGLSEMLELGVKLGAKKETLMGLSGLGDLILTCTDNQSRNRRLGLALGEGKTLEVAKESIGTIEGYDTAKNIFCLLEKHNIKASLCHDVYAILYQQKNSCILFDRVFNRIGKQA